MRERRLRIHKRLPYGMIADESTDEFGVAACGAVCGKPAFPIVPVLSDDRTKINCQRPGCLDALEQEIES